MKIHRNARTCLNSRKLWSRGVRRLRRGSWHGPHLDRPGRRRPHLARRRLADGARPVRGLLRRDPALRRRRCRRHRPHLNRSDGPSGSWTFENLVPFEAEGTGAGTFVGNALFAASCASTSLCALVGANSRIFTATDPFAAPAASPTGNSGKRARKRPRTILVFAEGFWKSSLTRRHRIKARFRFYSRDGARGFLCQPDRGRWRRCHSPLRYWTPIGRHVLRVRATGRTGLRGPVTSLRFEVRHRHRR